MARIDLPGFDALDTSGAWLLHQLERNLGCRGRRLDLAGLRDRQATLFAEIRRLAPDSVPAARRVDPCLLLLAQLGRRTTGAAAEALRLLAFYGQTSLALTRIVVEPGRLRLTSLTTTSSRAASRRCRSSA